MAIGLELHTHVCQPSLCSSMNCIHGFHCIQYYLHWVDLEGVAVLDALYVTGQHVVSQELHDKLPEACSLLSKAFCQSKYLKNIHRRCETAILFGMLLKEQGSRLRQVSDAQA